MRQVSILHCSDNNKEVWASEAKKLQNPEEVASIGRTHFTVLRSSGWLLSVPLEQTQQGRQNEAEGLANKYETDSYEQQSHSEISISRTTFEIRCLVGFLGECRCWGMKYPWTDTRCFVVMDD